MNTILITGSNGFVGRKVIEAFAENADVQIVATSRTDNQNNFSKNYRFERLDITNKTEVEYLVNRYQPTAIVNCAGMSQPDECENNKAECWALNVEAVNHLVEAANKIDAHLVHLSTDLIFDGIKGLYTEEDTPNPVNFYGLSKVESEKIIERQAKKWAIVRTVLVYGYSKGLKRSNLILRVKQSLENQQTIRVVDDQFRTPTLAEDLAEAIKTITIKQIQGIFNISGNEYLSLYETACIAANVFGLNSKLITPVSSISVNDAAKRPLRTGFRIDKAIGELNFRPRSLREGLQLVNHLLKAI